MIYMYINWLFYIFTSYNKHCFKDKNGVSLKKYKCHITLLSSTTTMATSLQQPCHFPLSPRWPLWRRLTLELLICSQYRPQYFNNTCVKCCLYHTFSKGFKNMENKVVCVWGKKVQAVLLQNSTGCHTSWVRFNLDMWQINFNERTVSNTRLALK